MSTATRPERKFHNLSYPERHALERKDPARHSQLKADWVRAGRPALNYIPEAAPPELRLAGKEYRELTGLERARLSRDNPKLYEKMRAHWQNVQNQPPSPSHDGPEAA